ncbi:MAG: insulinase family protein [Prevotellaceae bacterium]|jgi:predicted Zn-dependent peptidase|nr:insulinase family protein [Prevotellaceae bacterium]
MEQQLQVITLPNGIRIAHIYCKSRVAYCGFTINTGTRDELPDEHGMAHFLEHTLFKGTHKRKAYHINNRLENVGGELNAFTTKEETVIHATVLKSDLEKAIELIADITFNSVFPEKEIEKEKTVIYDEIDSYRDSPSELIFDDFEDLLFTGSPLGRNTLGSKRMLKRFTINDIRRFINRTYNSNQMVFTVIGQVPFTKIQQWCGGYFGLQPANNRAFQRQLPAPYIPFSKTMHKSTFQAHCLIGNRAYEVNNKKRVALSLLTNLLGGPTSNSILNTILREKHGLAYTVETSYTAYADTGVLNIYFGTAKPNLEKCIKLIHTELQKVCNTALSAMQLHKIKKQLTGQLTIACESNEQLMLSLGKSLLALGYYETMHETVNRIQAVTAVDIMEAANEIVAPQYLSTLIYA